MGQIRAPTLAALLLVYRGRSPAEAAAYVRRRRPISDPDEAILRVLHKYLLKKRKEEDDRNEKAKEKVDDTTDSKVSEQEEEEPAPTTERDTPSKKRATRSPTRA